MKLEDIIGTTENENHEILSDTFINGKVVKELKTKYKTRKKYCDLVAKSDEVKPLSVVRHSYARNRLMKNEINRIENTKGLFPALTTRSDTLGIKIVEENGKTYVRKPTLKEMTLLMGFDIDDYNVLRNQKKIQVIKQLGNSIVVNVMEGVIEKMLSETRKWKVLELFGGIGAPRKAMINLGLDFEVVDYVEIDKYAVQSYNALYNENYEPQDIKEWNKDIEADIIFHGSPCQDFSLAGYQKGGHKDSGTRSSLMWETVRIIEKVKPKYVVWENVKNVLSPKHKPVFEKYLQKMESLGYENDYQILNAKDFGVPQNRERVFVVSKLK